ncbi:hypothetical protein SBRCBS47491_005093 [Sporothrix bragantina]|uniref:CCD97-like C-terminal domain-containing protein n=1 Tax=Sporothrix bragantina TaxID=671064 RepID=A0ABP0BTT9_9PEZI
MDLPIDTPPEQTPGLSSVSSQPRPRPDRSANDAQRVRVRNRRLEYLRRNPSYLASSDREFVNVALYNTLIRSFQTPAERAVEAQDSGFGHVLEASILRNPEPLHRADDDDIVEEEDDEEGDKDKTNGKEEISKGAGEEEEDEEDLDIDPDLPPREAARLRWEALVRKWFVGGGAGLDDGFDYSTVDDDSDYDALARADAEAAWFDEESPGWASEEDGEGGAKKEKTGETGIQDF